MSDVDRPFVLRTGFARISHEMLGALWSHGPHAYHVVADGFPDGARIFRCESDESVPGAVSIWFKYEDSDDLTPDEGRAPREFSPKCRNLSHRIESPQDSLN